MPCVQHPIVAATAAVTSPGPAFADPFPGGVFSGLEYGFGIGDMWTGF